MKECAELFQLELANNINSLIWNSILVWRINQKTYQPY